ncbi:MAG: sterol desaturase family protein [Candidatus Sericytochromatia bacterium]|nr:sterol desaturase family protein [Candidatus Sericytochromatia bacterium]
MTPEALRLLAFGGSLLLLGLAEWRWPLQAESPYRLRRWGQHAGLALLNSLLIRGMFASAAVGAAHWASAQQLGLLPWLGQHLGLPNFAQGLLGFVLLDLALYLQHRLFHHWPWLWRLHRVHHADPMLDASSGLRFHPLEALLSMGFKMLMVIALGLPAAWVLAFEIWLNSCALFNHSNLRLPARLERSLRWLLITPELHRIHHGQRQHQQQRNFGFSVSCWDRWLGTYCDHSQPLVLGDSAWPAGPQRWRQLLLEIPQRPVSKD